MRTNIGSILWPLLAVAAVSCTPADDAGSDAEAPAGEAQPAEAPEQASEEMLSSWRVRLDSEGADEAGFQMAAGEEGFSVQTGPAGITWRAVDLVQEGDYTVSATFTEVGSPVGHREAYGLFVGGKHLEDPDQEYTYFLVRADGSYLIKRRTGEDTEELVGWTSSESVESVMTEGEENPNMLVVGVDGDQVEFVVNGAVVETLPVSEVRPWGIAGIRINHNLDVRVEDWNVEGATGQTTDEETEDAGGESGGGS